MTFSDLPLIMVWCLVWTLALELWGSVVLGLRRSDLLYVVLVNVMTNPVLVSVTTLILLTCGMRAYYISLAVFETAAFVAEALVYRRTLRAKINPFLLSALLNAVSFFLGNVINRVFF